MARTSTVSHARWVVRKFLLIIPIVALVGGSAIVLVANPGSGSGVVDGWVIGPAASCPEIGASSQTQCQALLDRAAGAFPVKAGVTVLRASIHRAGARMQDGQQVLQAYSATTVLGLALIEYSDGKRHAITFGCAGLPSPSGAGDPLCPNGGTPFP